MARHRLDDIDRQILAELQAEGRMTNVELATRVKITAPPCLRRVRVLEKAGYIKGYHAELDAGHYPMLSHSNDIADYLLARAR